MSAWTSDELDRIDEAEELQISPRYRDDSLAKPRIVWVVRSGDDVYVRSVDGRGSAWFGGALERHEATVRVGGVEKDVSLIETNEADDMIDDAYQAKYGRRYPTIVPSIVAPKARAATLRLVPR
jgi:hypothetical protein